MTPAISPTGEYGIFDKVPKAWTTVPARPGVDYTWDGSKWVLDAAKSKEQNQAAIRNQIIVETPYFAMLFIHLIQKLIQKGVVSASDFSATDQAEYNKIKTWIDNYLNL